MTTPRTEKVDAVYPQFEPLVGRSGVHIRDPVEDVQAMLYTDSVVRPRPTESDGFVYPVDSACEVTVTRLETPFLLSVWVRDLEGNHVAEFDMEDSAEKFTADDYLLEFTGMGMKIYVQIRETGFRIIPTDDSIVIVFDPETVLRLGARSLHSQPARTLTATDEPKSLMRAVSLFGNTMKTWSPERTWPSLRGHPPLLEIDTTPDIPPGLTPPDNGVRLTVPPEHDWLYPAVPLAYWVGATVEPGPPTLYADGEPFPLGVDGGYRGGSDRRAFERHVRDVLQFTFLLDCAVRTEGFYNVELDARRRVEASGLSLDFERLYDASLAERVITYLELEETPAALESAIGRPGWRLTTDVQPEPERASILPFLARDLSVVRCLNDDRLADVVTNAPWPADGDAGADGAFGSGARRSSDGTRTSSTENGERIIHLPPTESSTQAWVGEGFAVGAAKTSTTSYHRRLETHAEATSSIDIDVVVNDEEMTDEASVSAIYGTREELSFDISVHQNLSVSELADVFERDTDFVHYIGHVDAEGFDCADGHLSSDQLGTVGADAFVLNACSSYEQGQQLVDRGAIAGVVTLEDVINSMATKIGKSIARLLNYGFPLGSATSLIQETMFSGSNYVVVGDSNATIAQSNIPVPNVARVDLRRDGRFDVSIEAFGSWNYDVGSMIRPYIEGWDCHYVVPGELDTWTLGDDGLDDFFSTSTFPVLGAKSLFWSDELSAEALRDHLRSYE